MINQKELKFLEESNSIEEEYTAQGFVDSLIAWQYSKDVRNEIKPSIIQKIHKRLMKRLNPRIAGKFRKCDVFVGNRKCMRPELIHEELRLLCNPGLFPISSDSLIKRWHIEFEKIHPFEDGNGRVGRIIMNAQRMTIALPVLIIHKGKEQQEYYKWFKEK